MLSLKVFRMSLHDLFFSHGESKETVHPSFLHNQPSNATICTKFPSQLNINVLQNNLCENAKTRAA